jgi:predicted ATPase
VTLCRQLGLFRSYGSGSLAGSSIDADRLAELLAEARLAHAASPAKSGPPIREEMSHDPAGVASMVGREWEIGELARVTMATRLTTLTGTGGVGKTRLALRVADEVRAAFPGGAWLVELADITDPAVVSLAIAHGVGVREIPGRDPYQVLVQELRTRRLLLVLDNCEQVRDGVAVLVSALLGDCADVHILVTSRERLGVAGEIAWPLAPLITPSVPAESIGIIGQSDAVRLFVERARAVRPDFTLTADNAADVARVCKRLDGLPLAIELAAARVALLTPAELDARLADSFDLLATTSIATTGRHRTVRATLDWSWNLLSEDERALLARLAVFVDGCGLDAIERVCGPTDLAVLARLVDRSLVTSRPDPTGRSTRYRLLETVRVYAYDKLAERGESAIAERRLATWCIEMANFAGREIHGPAQADWYRWIDAEYRTIRSVVVRALEQDDADTAFRLIAPLWWAWGVLGRGTEAEAWAERALSFPADGALDSARAGTLLGAAALASFAGNAELAHARLAEAEAAAVAIEDTEAVLSAVGQRARLLQFQGDFEEAARLADDALDHYYDEGQRWAIARLLEVRAHAALRAGQALRARAALEDALRLARREGDTWSRATVLAELGDLARSEDRSADAAALYRESLTLRQSLGIPGSTPSLYQNVGFVAVATGDATAATESFRRALNGFRRGGDSRGIAECVIGLAGVAVLVGTPASAARLIGWADASLRSIGAEVWPSTRKELAWIVAAAIDALGTDSWEQECAQGATLSFEEMLAVADVGGDARQHGNVVDLNEA